jgi:CubicO group peptidase (beta-lactamase class C family)
MAFFSGIFETSKYPSPIAYLSYSISMKNIAHIVKALMPQGPMDAVGVGIIDFKKNSYQAFEAMKASEEILFKGEPTTYFDLASLTKPLTNSLAYFLKPEAFDKPTELCLNHRGGLPSWGLLSKDSWKEQVLSYPITESPTVYSDFSALRVLLELNKKGVDQKKICTEVWDKETMFWTDLPFWYPTLQFGYVNQRPNFGKVHDPNARVIGEFCTHAGLFSTTDGLCRTLLNYQRRTDFIAKTKSNLATHTHRFAHGWDRVENPAQTLAGAGCGTSTFGHLGFTGTSIWIDPDKMIGQVILTNATKHHWFDKTALNELRRAIGEMVWKNQL